MSFFNSVLDRFGMWIAQRLEETSSGYEPFTPSDPETLAHILQPGDVLLVEGNQKVSAAIKYLTQSTWSHSALYVGEALKEHKEGQSLGEDGTRQDNTLIEVNLGEGCVAVPLSKYKTYNTRICRPVNLTEDDRQTLVRFMVDRLGLEYDMRNIFDLLRYTFPTPPVPIRWRRRMISLGSGEPTRAICSTLIAQGFQKIKYPILPKITRAQTDENLTSPFSRREILHIRHHSLFAPRDFDISPYFEIVKPTLAKGFNYKGLTWSSAPAASSAPDQKAQPLEEPKAAEQTGEAQHSTNMSLAQRDNKKDDPDS